MNDNQERQGEVGASWLSDVGPAWSRSNAQFEAGNPGFGMRLARELNPLTGFGSAIGQVHDAASNGDAVGVGLGILQAYPAFAATRLITSAAKPMMKAIPARPAASLLSTAKNYLASGFAGAAADQTTTPAQAQPVQPVGSWGREARANPGVPNTYPWQPR